MKYDVNICAWPEYLVGQERTNYISVDSSAPDCGMMKLESWSYMVLTGLILFLFGAALIDNCFKIVRVKRN